MAYLNGGRIVLDGLVLALDAGDKNSYPGNGTTWSDYSGNGNNGTLTNNTTFNSGNGGYMVFDGVDDYVNCGSSTSIAITGDMSICAFVYFSSLSGYNSILGKTSNNSIPASYDYYTNPGSPTSLTFLRGNGSSYSSVISNTNMSANTWHGIAVTMAGTSVTHYLNGNSNGTGTLSTTIGDNGNSLYIGNRGDLFTDMNGRIASVLIYNRALSASEILQNYNAQKTRFGLK